MHEGDSPTTAMPFGLPRLGVTDERLKSPLSRNGNTFALLDSAEISQQNPPSLKWEVRVSWRIHPNPLACSVLLISSIFAARGLAYSGGISGVSGKVGQTCNQAFCHGGGVAPTVTLEGPTELAPAAIATFRFVIRSNSPQQIAAGLNVASSGGTLISLPNQGTRLLSGELTHTMPKNNDTNGQAVFEFQWQAPSEPGSYTLFAAGNSVNRNGTNQGDLAAATTLVVRVAAPSTPTPTPTPTELPPSPTPTATIPPATPTPTDTETPLLPSATPTPSVTPDLNLCRGDCDGNGEVTVDEIITGVNIALGALPLDRCSAMDTNVDGEITIDELLQAVNALLSGCAM